LDKLVWYQCGTWPQINLEDIRADRESARQLLRSGVNPNDSKKAERIESQAKVEAVIAERASQEKRQDIEGNRQPQKKYSLRALSPVLLYSPELSAETLKKKIPQMVKIPSTSWFNSLSG
jgi:hypothetical protein